MKTNIFSIILSAAATVALGACSDDWNPDSANGYGTLNTEFGVSVDNAETTVADNSAAKAKRLSRAGASKASATVILNDFIVTVEDNKGNEVQTWTYSTLPELPTFPVGDYKVVVRSHNVEPAAWDAPYYEGEQAFSIQANKITEVGQVVCHLSNIRVSVKLSEKLLAALDDKTAPVVKITSTGATSLEFVPGEKKSAYFAATAELTTLRVDFSASINGNVESFTKTIDNVEKGQHRKLTFNLTANDNLPPEELGTITNSGEGITIDNSVVEDEPIQSDYPWFEDNLDTTGRPGDENFEDPEPVNPDDPNTPVTQPITFESDNIDFKDVNQVDDFGEGKKSAQVKITSENGFAHINVTIISPYLTADFLEGIELSDKFDLAEPANDTLAEKLTGLGFPDADTVKNATEPILFDITSFVPLINLGKMTADHTFQIEVIDKKGNSNSISFTFHSIKPNK